MKNGININGEDFYLFVFHDPPQDGKPRVVRATTVGLLRKNGSLFVGVSVCSEEEQFKRKVGLHIALSDALKALREHRCYTAAFPIPSEGREVSKEEWQVINRAVEKICTERKIARFKQILSDRHRLLRGEKVRG